MFCAPVRKMGAKAAGVGGTIGAGDAEGDGRRGRANSRQVRQPPLCCSSNLQKARELAQQDPKAVANIIKDWTGANAS
jgi:flagellar M-ring protein FliF